MKRLQLIYKNLKRLQLVYKESKELNLQESKELKESEKNWKNKEDAMGCITDAMCITGALDHVFSLEWLAFLYHLPDFRLNTCPIAPESKVMSCEQFPPHPAVYKANWACQNQNHYEATS